jgi:squalene-hopene/tetraprenyl-beta-curcumene cyclase
MISRLGLLFVLAAGAILAADWNPRLAADYLDSRQKEWFDWPAATANNGTACISCHTNLSYLVVRPALRRALGEGQPTTYETRFLETMRARAEKSTGAEMYPKSKAPSHAAGAESIFTALILAMQDPDGAATQKAFDRLWSMQIRDGKAKGSWDFFETDLDPWETNGASPYFGAALAAFAAGAMPADYRAKSEIREHIADLTGYLQREGSSQSLHNRIFALWASTALPDAMPHSARKALIDELWSKQEPDGGWSNESLGPWKKRETAPPSAGSNSYSTALVAYVLEKTGVPASKPALGRALTWLRSHQDPQGFWAADSMNKYYPADSMQIRFMRDAATGFAALALLM